MEGEQARPGTRLVGRAPVTLQLPSRYPDLILEVRLGALMTPHEPRTIPEASRYPDRSSPSSTSISHPVPCAPPLRAITSTSPASHPVAQDQQVLACDCGFLASSAQVQHSRPFRLRRLCSPT